MEIEKKLFEVQILVVHTFPEDFEITAFELRGYDCTSNACTHLLRRHIEGHGSQVNLGVALNARQYEENTCQLHNQQNYSYSFCCIFTAT